jgi:hypothetical protein
MAEPPPPERLHLAGKVVATLALALIRPFVLRRRNRSPNDF